MPKRKRWSLDRKCPHLQHVEHEQELVLNPGICSHLTGPDGIDFYLSYDVYQPRHDLLCAECFKNIDFSHVYVVCPECWKHAFNAHELEECAGKPAHFKPPREHITTFDEPTMLDHVQRSDVVAMDIQSQGEHVSLWCLHHNGRVQRHDVSKPQHSSDNTFTVELPGEPLSLVLSPSGRYACVVQTYDSLLHLYETSTGALIKTLSRGDYHVQHSVFPAQFVMCEGRELLVCGSSWNRVNVYDPAQDCVCLTTPPVIENTNDDDDDDDENDGIDYFYGRLYASPGSQWLVSSGWCWHPVGVMNAWSLPAWLEGEPRHNETHNQDPYFLVSDDWDRIATFIEDAYFVVWGIWHDSSVIRDGVMILDTTSWQVTKIIPLGEMTCQALSWTGAHLAVLDQEGKVWFIDIDSGAVVGCYDEFVVVQIYAHLMIVQHHDMLGVVRADNV